MDGLRSVAEGGVWLYDSEHGRHHVIREVLVGVVLARQETGRVGVGLHVAVHGGCPLLHLKRMTGPDDVNLRMVEYIPSGVC